MKTLAYLRMGALAGVLSALTSPTFSASLPDRIITLGAPVTETVFALGEGARVVAVDLSSEYPAETRTLPRLGYHRAVSAEGILSLRPGLVIGTEDAGPPAALEQLRAAKTRVVLVPATPSAEGARTKIRAIAQALGKESEGEKLVATLDAELEAARSRIGENGVAPRVLFIYARGQGALSVAGRNTAADAMLRLAGAVNAVNGYEGYKPLTPEALAEARPDVLLLTTSGLQSVGEKSGLLRQPGVSLTPAGRAGRIIALDDELLLGFGPRLGQGVLALTELLYPEPHGQKQDERDTE